MTHDGRPAPVARAVPEQPDDWTEPGAHPVGHGVHRLPLPLPSDGLRAVNVYVIEDADGLVLVDAGWAGAPAASALERGLRLLGHGLDDIARVYVTHAHYDHYTQAMALRADRGARVLLGRGEAATVDGLMRMDEVVAPQPALLRRAGAPQLAAEFALVMKDMEARDDIRIAEPDGWLDDGETLSVAGRVLDVLATPGHTSGHVVFRDTGAGALFAGDHVLPHITPSIGFERVPEPAPLRSYLASLRLVRDLPDALLLPAHGPVTASVHTRVDELLAHHEQRLAIALALVQGGSSTAHEVASGMAWTRRAHRLDEMEVMHATLAVLEIAAHLDVLVDAGELVVADVAGVARYAEA